MKMVTLVNLNKEVQLSLVDWVRANKTFSKDNNVVALVGLKVFNQVELSTKFLVFMSCIELAPGQRSQEFEALFIVHSENLETEDSDKF